MTHGKFKTMSNGKRTTIDSAGRLVIPKSIRQGAGLRAGQLLEVTLREGRVVIEPVPTPMRVERRGRVSVAVPTEPVEELTAEEVEDTLRSLRERHDLEE